MSAADELMPDGSARSGLSQDVVSNIVRERADALAEVARLREALARASRALDEVVAYFDDGHRMPPAGFPLASVIRPAQRFARSALEGTEEEPSP